MRCQQATAIGAVNNHPSGDPTPSAADGSLTAELVWAGELPNIEELDYLIIGWDRWLSLKRRIVVSQIVAGPSHFLDGRTDRIASAGPSSAPKTRSPRQALKRSPRYLLLLSWLWRWPAGRGGSLTATQPDTLLPTTNSP